ncbi:TPA: hypothetical protein N0F65_010046 [Lagenidium giganteum]|uniref:separase n=1 Tax=Lagenidium giganteum TaxID=4803 RepID=A0AAV2ZEV7_9STRA|nr:TPA: hypothetical protein N0F65_010046 [Lagenidium giganteum]
MLAKAMPMALSEATKASLLKATQARGRAAKTLEDFISAVDVTTVSEAAADACFLQALVPKVSNGARAQPATKRKKPSAGEVKAMKELGIVAAKVAQAVIRTYAAVAAADRERTGGAMALTTECAVVGDDVATAMRLASIALLVVWNSENVVRVGELVLENMLYQVAKQFAEMDKCKLECLCVLASLHVRLWDYHRQLAKDKIRSAFASQKHEQLALDAATTKTLCELPLPSPIHSSQFARLVMGYVHVTAKLLQDAKHFQVSYGGLCVLDITSNSCTKWIDYLASFPDTDAKSISIHYDRAFRLLWKCASQMETEQPPMVSESLEFRSAAVACMLKCSNYSPTYIIQQVHRVGVQHERKTSKEPKDQQQVANFYLRSANTLSPFVKKVSYPNVRPTDLDMARLLWLEHFAGVCGDSNLRVEQVLVIESMIAAVPSSSSSSLVNFCCRLLLAMVCIELSTTDVICSNWKQTIKSNPCFGDSDGHIGVFFGKLTAKTKLRQFFVQQVSECLPSDPVVADSNDVTHGPLLQFASRIISRATTKLYNSLVNATTKTTFACSDLEPRMYTIALSVQLLRDRCPSEQTSQFTALLIRAIRMSVSLESHARQDRTQQLAQILQTARKVMKRMSSEDMVRALPEIKIIWRDAYAVGGRLFKQSNFKCARELFQEVYSFGVDARDQVMNKLEALELNEFDRSLRLDSVCSLLSTCFKEDSLFSESCHFASQAVVYSSLSTDTFPATEVTRLAQACLECCVETWSDSPSGDEAFLNQAMEVLQANRVPSAKVSWILLSIQKHAQHASERQLEEIRTGKLVKDLPSARKRLQQYSKLEKAVWHALMKFNHISKTQLSTWTSIIDAIALRHQSLAEFYESGDTNAYVATMMQAFNVLTNAAKRYKEASLFEEGVVKGWRCVIALELLHHLDYATTIDERVSKLPPHVSKTDALRDVEEAIQNIDASSKSGDRAHIVSRAMAVTCLEAMCSSLVMISSESWETEARIILQQLRLDQWAATNAESTPPPTFLYLSPVISQFDGGRGTSRSGLETLDDRIAKAVACTLEGLFDQAVTHLSESLCEMHALREGNAARRGKAVSSKALGMRELLVHLVLAEIHFQQGRTRLAIRVAKSALSMCWKLSRKYAYTAIKNAHTVVDARLPDEVKKYSGSVLGNTTYFQAREFSSWDILQATNVVLCRIGAMYGLAGSPHRAAMYYVKAVELVAGLNLQVMHRVPYCDLAQLMVNSAQVRGAREVMAVMIDLHRGPSGSIGNNGLVHFANDGLHVAQRCKELLQHGDMEIAECAWENGLAEYERTYELLSSCDGQRRLPSVFARCCRKVTMCKSIGTFYDSDFVDDLIAWMGILKRALKGCRDPSERIACSSQLAKSNIMLLRSTSEKAFMSLDRTIKQLERTFPECMRLGVPHLIQQVSLLLGLASLLKLNQLGSGECSEESADQLSWQAAFFLISSLPAPSVAYRTSEAATELEQVMTDAQLMDLAKSLQHQPHAQPKSIIQAFREGIQTFPSSWTIVALVSSFDDEVIFVRMAVSEFFTGMLLFYHRAYKTQSVHTPVAYAVHNDRIKQCVMEVESVIRDSREMLGEEGSKVGATMTTQEKRNWWNQRLQLDDQLNGCVRKMEASLGYWRALLSPNSGSDVERAIATIQLTFGKVLTAASEVLLRLLIQTVGQLSDDDIERGVRRSMWLTEEVKASDQAVQEVLQLIRSFRTVVPAPDHDTLGCLKVSDLKKKLGELNLATNGSKADLIDRLMTAQTSQLSRSASVILMLDKIFQSFPWEAIDVLRMANVTRLPSPDILANIILTKGAEEFHEVCNSRVAFVLNPGGDLHSTQEHLMPIMTNGINSLGWHGIVGRAPSADEMRNALSTSDVFIYCGHGAGEKYLHREEIGALQGLSTTPLLFGCSSGRMEHLGIFGPDGALVSYLRAGCPAAVSMLWDVTDRDLDKLSEKLLRTWLNLDKKSPDPSAPIPLERALAHARRECKLKFLNGFAAVCYGLPGVIVSTCQR